MFLEEPGDALKVCRVLEMMGIVEDILNSLAPHLVYESNRTSTFTQIDELKPAWAHGSIVICEFIEAPARIFFQPFLTPHTIVGPSVLLIWVLPVLQKIHRASLCFAGHRNCSHSYTHTVCCEDKSIDRTRTKTRHSQTCTLLLHLQHVDKGMESGD